MPLLGVIADDFTGATDVAGMLVRGGLRTVLAIGVPQGDTPEVDAVVVALKSRTAPVDEAVRESLAACRWLQAAGARQFYFKVCSTFDSTPRGNIGPVAEALMEALGTRFSIVCPAFPENGRTVFRGHLFVGDALLSDTGMRDHPLTPMTDSNLVRLMQAQSRARVGLIRHDVVARGAQAVRARIDALVADGVLLGIADAIDDDALRTLAQAVVEDGFVVAGSGVALGLPEVCAARGWVVPDAGAARLDAVGGQAVVLSGSCSSATNAQVAAWRGAGRPALRIDPRQLAAGEQSAADVLAWAAPRLADGAVLVHATAAPEDVKAAQAALGVERAGALVEQCLAQVAQGLVERGVRRLVVAGGETSGAVVGALGVKALRIGASIDPGVPWTQAEGRPLLLALKSGNFGTVDFFAKALAQVA